MFLQNYLYLVMNYLILIPDSVPLQYIQRFVFMENLFPFFRRAFDIFTNIGCIQVI